MRAKSKWPLYKSGRARMMATPFHQKIIINPLKQLALSVSRTKLTPVTLTSPFARIAYRSFKIRERNSPYSFNVMSATMPLQSNSFASAPRKKETFLTSWHYRKNEMRMKRSSIPS